jgi:anti-anti-sigma factor
VVAKVPVPLQVTLACDGVVDPDVSTAPSHVLVRVGPVTSEQVQQFRRVLHELVSTGLRTVVVDLTDLDEASGAIVFAVVVGAARKARSTGAELLVCCPPPSLRRAFGVAGLTEAPAEHTAEYSLVFAAASDSEAFAV